MIQMKSLTDFHNPQIVRGDGTQTVKPGDTFETTFVHAKDLVVAKMAEPIDPKALEREPTEAIEPHSSISAPDLKAINDRRAKAAAEKAAAEKAAPALKDA